MGGIVLQPNVNANTPFVAVPEESDADTNVRNFGCFPDNLQGLADSIAQGKTTLAAMEPTGTYW